MLKNPGCRPRRETFAVGAVLSVYGLVLSAAWCARTVYEQMHHAAAPVSEQAQATAADDYRRKSEPICRLFNAPGDPSDWTVYTQEAYEGGTVRRAVFAVDCTGHEPDFQGRSQGAFVVWQAGTGALYMVSNAAAKAIRDGSPSSPDSVVEGLTPDAAVHAARQWLERLRLQDARNPWQLSASPRGTNRSWQVRWHRHQQLCQMTISRDSGDLILMQLPTHKSVRVTATIHRPPAG